MEYPERAHLLIATKLHGKTIWVRGSHREGRMIVFPRVKSRHWLRTSFLSTQILRQQGQAAQWVVMCCGEVIWTLNRTAEDAAHSIKPHISWDLWRTAADPTRRVGLRGEWWCSVKLQRRIQVRTGRPRDRQPPALWLSDASVISSHDLCHSQIPRRNVEASTSKRIQATAAIEGNTEH